FQAHRPATARARPGTACAAERSAPHQSGHLSRFGGEANAGRLGSDSGAGRLGNCKPNPPILWVLYAHPQKWTSVVSAKFFGRSRVVCIKPRGGKHVGAEFTVNTATLPGVVRYALAIRHQLRGAGAGLRGRGWTKSVRSLASWQRRCSENCPSGVGAGGELRLSRRRVCPRGSSRPAASAMPDIHQGYGFPIGGVVRSCWKTH